MPKETVGPPINPVHFSILDTVRGTYVTHGAKLLYTPSLNQTLGRTHDGSTYLTFAGKPPIASRLLTPDGSYPVLGTHVGVRDRERTLRDLVFDLSGDFNVEVLDAEAADAVRRQVRSEIPPRGYIWRISPLRNP